MKIRRLGDDVPELPVATLVISTALAPFSPWG